MYDDYKVSDDLKSMMNNERIVWSGRPKKSCFVLEWYWKKTTDMLISQATFLS